MLKYLDFDQPWGAFKGSLGTRCTAESFWQTLTLFKTQHLENRHTLFSNTYPSRPNKLVPTLPTLVLINNAYVFCNKPNFVTAMTRRTLPSTVLNMAREKKKRAPKSVCYRFYRETETDYASTLCIQLRISRELHVGCFKKKSLKVFALIFGAFFLVII